MSEAPSTTPSLAVGRALAAGSLDLMRRGELVAYLRRFRESQAILRLNLFLALPELRGSRRLGLLAWRVAAHRLYNDLDFAALRWQPYTVQGEQHLEQALDAGRGAIVASQHLGPYRRLFWELLGSGRQVHALVDRKVHRSFRANAEQQLRRQGLDTSALARLTVHDAEAPGSVRKLLDALRGNGVLLVYLDGNTGVEAPGSSVARQANCEQVTFFGMQLAVRRGVCQLAHATGAPIIPAFAHWRRGHRAHLELLDSLRPAAGESMPAFSARGMQLLFAHSEEAIRARPEQYEEWVHAHRWRLDSKASEPSPELLARARTELQGQDGSSWRLAPQRALLLRVGQRQVLVDGEAGRILSTGPLLAKLGHELRRGRRVTQLVHRLGPQHPRRGIVDALARLRAAGLLEEARHGA